LGSRRTFRPGIATERFDRTTKIPSLPAHLEKAPPGTTGELKEAMASPARILFVDDEPAILNAVKRLFRREPYQIETAPDGKAGLEVFRRFRPAVVVSDHRMPGMTGVEFLAKVRAIDPESVRIILTGCTDLPAAEAAINQGEVWRFLTKPWNDEDLRATVAGAIERHRLVDENRVLLDKLASIGLLAGGVAHELNNPIGGILAYSQLLTTDLQTGVVPAADALTRDLKSIEEAAHRCKRIVAELLDFARTSKSAQRSVISIDDAAERAISLARFQIRGSTEVIRELGGPSLPPVFADVVRVEQVVLNLISNAIQALEATPARGGKVRVKTFVDGETVCVEVSDEGPGIPAEVRDRIFEPFFTTKEPGKGTGLGLTVSQGIAHEHGGWIDVRSEPGAGATFTVHLPALIGAANQPAA
jgi:two-component system NtrC family sensor kinase